jgi:hemoglobin
MIQEEAHRGGESPVTEEVTLDDRLIEKLIRAFYDRARVDPLIGPIFNSRIQDWEPHLARICDFWSAVMLKSSRYRGQPMGLHLPLPIDSTHFDRWVELFERTARELCPASIAEQFAERARTIGRSLEMGVAAADGTMLVNGERYLRKSA